MGLSVMEDVPGVDQNLRFANIAGQMSYMAPNTWVGESNLNGLGLGYGSGFSGDNQVNPNLDAILQGAPGIIQSIASLRGNKKNKGGQNQQPMARRNPTDMTGSAVPAQETVMSKWLIYGGVALAAVAILFVVLKKKEPVAAKE